MTEPVYPADKWDYSPSEDYPEYRCEEIAPERNEVYERLRDGFFRMGLDAAHFGTRDWNPLGDLIRPGQTVLVKPNLVMHENPAGGLFPLVTHPSLIRAVLDYVYLALQGTGRVIVGDAPVQSCDFDRLLRDGGYDRLTAFYRRLGKELKFYDFRNTIVERTADGVLIPKENRNGGFGCRVISLNENSCFAALPEDEQQKLRITNYPAEKLLSHHHGKVHEYLVTEALLQADVVINMPKPKAHRKAGVTGALKNMVGINASKEYLPHHRIGSAEEGGDEYLKKDPLKAAQTRLQERIDRANDSGDFKTVRKLQKESVLLYQLRKVTGSARSPEGCFSEGSWYGNRTIDKTIQDLQQIVFYADKEGVLRPGKAQRRMLVIADMVICGQKEGPLLPESWPLGGILMGEEPAATDRVILKLFGLPEERFPSVTEADKASATEIGKATDTAADIPSDGESSIAYHVPAAGISLVSNREEYCFASYEELPVAGQSNTLSSGWECVKDEFAQKHKSQSGEA